jgi:hypothetical protein
MHTASRSMVVSLMARVQTRRSLRHRRGLTGTVAIAVVVAVDLNTSSGMLRIVVYSVLHLTEYIVELDKVLLCPGVGEIILLSKRVGYRGGTSVSSHAGPCVCLGHVRFCAGHGAIRDREGTVKRQQRAANLTVGRRVDLATLHTAEEVVHHVVGALTVPITISSSSTVAQMLRALVVDGSLVEVQAIVGGRLRRIVARVTGLMGEARVTAHLPVVVVVAGGPLGLRPVAHAILGLLRRTDQHGIVGVSLDVLLKILGALERLAAELALVRLQRHMHTNMRRDVVTLDRGGTASVPLASEVEVVGALATNMTLTDMLIEGLW